LVANEWIINRNAYGYTGLSAEASAQVNGVVVSDSRSHINGNGQDGAHGQGNTGLGGAVPVSPNIDSKKFTAGYSRLQPVTAGYSRT
jgi:hypothetical protein